MGITDDKARFDEVGEDKRQDLAEYIKHGDLSTDTIKLPIKVIDLPEFLYDPLDMGGIGKGSGDPGDAVGQPQPSDDGDGDEAGDGDGEHGYYEMDPEEFAQELEDELELYLEPKGKTVSEEIEGGYTDIAHTGPSSTLDFDRFFKQTLKRELALSADRDYLRELMKVNGYGPKRVFEWARDQNIPISQGWVEKEYATLGPDEKTIYDSPDDIGCELRRGLDAVDMRELVFREEDKRHRYPRIIKKKERNVVVVNIRDVSGSMRKEKRDLVQRVFTPLDWYLTGKYDKAVFVYIAHDSSAWQVERVEFFGLKSGGGTRISTAYELAKELLDDEYPWTEWNRYVFAAGDGENSSNDTEQNVIPLMTELEANLHAYVEVQPSNARRARHGDMIEKHFGLDSSDVVVTRVNDKDDVMPAIKEILLTAGSEKKEKSS